MRARGAPNNPYDGIIKDVGKYPKQRNRNSAHRIMKSRRGKKHDEPSRSQEIEGKPEIEWNHGQRCSLQRKRSSSRRNMNGVESDTMRVELSSDKADMGEPGNDIYNANHCRVISKQNVLTADGEGDVACGNENFSRCGYDSECGGEGELSRAIGWSAMNTTAERTEVTQSDEEQMLQLSQGSVAQEGVLTGQPLSPVTSDTNETPEKRRKHQTGATRKRPRCTPNPNPIARDIFELLQSESSPSEGSHFVDPQTENTKEVHGKKISSCLASEGQEDRQHPEFDGDAKVNQNSDTSLEQDDLMEKRETSDEISAIEDLPSSESLKKVVITVRCNCPSECRHIDYKAKRERQFRRGPSGHENNLKASSPEKPRKVDKRGGNPGNKTTCSGEDGPRDASSHERRGMQNFMENYCDKKKKDGKWMNVMSTTQDVSSGGELEGTSEDRMHVNGLLRGEVGSQNCPVPTSNGGESSPESSPAEPPLPSGEDGYSLSREGVQMGLQVRQTLISHSSNFQDDLSSPRAESQSPEYQDTIGQATSGTEKRFQPNWEDLTEDERRSPQKAIAVVQAIKRDKERKHDVKSTPEVKQSELSPSNPKRQSRRKNVKANIAARKEELPDGHVNVVQGSQQNGESAESATYTPFTEILAEPVSPTSLAKNSVKARRKKPRSSKGWPQDNDGAGVTAQVDYARGRDEGEEGNWQQRKARGTAAESSRTVSSDESSRENEETHPSNYSHNPEKNNMDEKKSANGAEPASLEPAVVRTEQYPVTGDENRSGSEFPTVQGKSTAPQRHDEVSNMEVPIKPDIDGSTMDVDNFTARTEIVKAKHSGRKSKGEDLEDLVDRKELRKQSQLLVRRSMRLRKSRTGGTPHKASNKALDELSDNEDFKSSILKPPLPPSRSRSRPSTAQVERNRTHAMTTRRRASQMSDTLRNGAAVIDLTDSGDDDEAAVASRTAPQDDDIAENLKELQRLSLQDRSKAFSERPRCKYLTPLSSDESRLATQLVTQTKLGTRIVTIAEARITLLGESFKRLRGTRWLNDELLNAYVSLINSRNDAVFRELSEEHRSGIPRTYVFNTYFFTRLCPPSTGFDYPGVKGWTKRAKVDILQKDIILVPINLGNHHWVLSMIDMEHREILYLDSMHGPDTAKALTKLKQWVFEELRNKHGEDVAQQYDPNSWKEIKHRYRVRRIGVLPASLEAREAKVGRMARVPVQRDGGSCGVFTAKLADCLSLGIKVYFNQRDIPLIRRRMALDLFHGYLPL